MAEATKSTQVVSVILVGITLTVNTAKQSNIKGSREYCAQLLREKDQLIGKQATIRFFNLTPDNIPRFPFMVGVRDFE